MSRVPRSHVLLVDDLHLMGTRAGREPAGAFGGPECLARGRQPPLAAVDALTGDHPEARAEPARDRARPRLAVGRAHLPRAKATSSSRAVRRARPRSSPAGSRGSCRRRSLCHDERDCVDDLGHRDWHGRSRSGSPIGSTRSTPRCGTRSRSSASRLRSARRRSHSADGDIVMHGYAEGLLMRNGQPVPLVRSAVHATIPVGPPHRPEHRARRRARALRRRRRHELPRLGRRLHDEQVGDGARRSTPIGCWRPTRTARWSCTAAPSNPAWTPRRSRVGGAGGVGVGRRSTRRARCSMQHPRRCTDLTDGDRIADTSAATWAARGMMEQSWAVYRCDAVPRHPTRAPAPRSPRSASARPTALATDATTPAHDAPSTLGVSMELLAAGCARRSVAPTAPNPCSSTSCARPRCTRRPRRPRRIPELPAVIAAIVAMNLGDLDIAHTVIEDAIRGRSRRPVGAHRRLLLWRAWVAVQRTGRSRRARRSIAHWSPRVDAVSARRAARRGGAGRDRATVRGCREPRGRVAHARDSILRIEVDLYLLLPAGRAGQRGGARRRHRTRRSRTSPRRSRSSSGWVAAALWSTHLHWAGIQQGILLSRPEDLTPHAHALVAASPHSRGRGR